MSREDRKNDLRRRQITRDESALRRERLEFAGTLGKIVLFFAIVIGVLVGGTAIYRGTRVFRSYKVNWQMESSEENYVGYEEMGDVILKYGRNDVSAMNASGETLWTKACEMKNPDAVVCGDWAAVIDRKANAILICNEDGCQGSAETSLPIVKATISGSGVVAAILEDPDATYIVFYDKNGSKLDIEIKTVLSGDGYPVDLELSPSGQELAVSYVTVVQGTLESQVVFYNFKEGQTIDDRIVGGFSSEDCLTGRVCFIGDDRAVAVSDSKLEFYSLDDPLAPKKTKEYEVDSEIRSIFTSDSYVGIVTDTDDENSEEASMLTLFDGSGKIRFQKDFTFSYSEIRFAEDDIIMYNGSECRIYRSSGRLKFSGSFESEIKKVARIGSADNYLFVGSSSIESVKLN